MVLSDLSVRRPVLATVMSLIIIVFGAIAFFKLPLRELPDIDRPVVGIDVNYRGASAQVVETQITRVLEDQLSGIEGLEMVTATSRDGRASVNIEFSLERDLEDAANDVRDAVSRARNALPLDIDQPIVSKADADADPIIWYNVSSSTMDLVQLSDYTERYVADRLSVLDGVAFVRVGGQMRQSLKIWLDPDALAARGLTVEDIENALRRQNIEAPAGYMESQERDYSLRVSRAFQTPEEFARLSIGRTADGPTVRLGDVARIAIEAEEIRRLNRGNGVNSVGVGVTRQSKSNALNVADAVKAEIAEIMKSTPPGVTIALNMDATVFIRQAIDEVYKTLIEAIILVILVIFLFLGSLRAATVPAAVIPVCLVGVFAILATLGFTINLLTLLALVLSIGIIVDDSIVVLENIQRRVDEGEPPAVAAMLGARQVAFAVIATSAVLVAVFTPLLFVGGYVGKLFIELAATVAGVVVISAFCSLTLTPMMCSKMLRPVGEGAWLIRKTEDIIDRVRASYRRSVGAALDMKPAVLGLYAFVLCIGAFLFFQLPSELTPREDRGVMMVAMQAPEGAGFDYSRRVMQRAEEIVQSYREKGEVERYNVVLPGFGDMGTARFSSGMIRLTLSDWSKRKRNATIIAAELAKKLSEIPGAIFFVRLPEAFASGPQGGSDLQIVLGGPEYGPLAAVGDRIVQRLRGDPDVLAPRTNYEPNSPRILVDIDRERAAELGVSVQAIGRTLESTMGSRRVNTYTDRGREYYVYIQAERSDRSDAADLTNRFVRSDRTGELIPLSSVVTLKNMGDTAERRRMNRMAAITVMGTMAPGVALGAGIDKMEKIAREEIGSRGIKIDYAGSARQYKQASGAIYFAFGFALLIVFLVLAAQFESFIHPFVIMLTVPLATTGGLFGLYLFGSTLNIYSQIGIIILIALAAKNGILIVEFANQLRAQGRNVRDAVLGAADLRMRPILMTSCATMIGAAPLIFSLGAGAESRRTIGVVIVFGVMLATLLTLFVVPVLYEIFARFTRTSDKARREIEAFEKALGAAHGHPAE